MSECDGCIDFYAGRVNYHDCYCQEKTLKRQDYSPMNPYTFKLGDRVSFGGLEGKVSNVQERKIQVTFTPYEHEWFTVDGRLDTKHTQPLLVLIEPAPKQKRKVSHKCYFVCYPDGTIQTCSSLQEVNTEIEESPIAGLVCREITWEAEVDHE